MTARNVKQEQTGVLPIATGRQAEQNPVRPTGRQLVTKLQTDNNAWTDRHTYRQTDRQAASSTDREIGTHNYAGRQLG